MYKPMEETASERLTRIMDGCIVAQLVHVVAELGIADLVAERPLPVTDLASLADTDPESLYRALRVLAGAGVFTETAPRVFGETPLSHVLRSDAEDSVRELARVRGSRELWHSWRELRHSVSTGRSAFEYVHGVDWWSYLNSHPEQAELFNGAMGDNTHRVHTAVADACDLSGVGHLVDVGGGHGTLTVELLRRYPGMTATVVDQPHASSGARQVFAEAGVTDRATFVARDFFESVPTGGDAYVLCRILHDWDSERARALLGRVRSAMTASARAFVVDAVLPEGNDPHPAKVMDIIMLALHEGRERTGTEFAALLEESGFRHTETRRTASPMRVIVADTA